MPAACDLVVLSNPSRSALKSSALEVCLIEEISRFGRLNGKFFTISSPTGQLFENSSHRCDPILTAIRRPEEITVVYETISLKREDLYEQV